MPVVCVGPDFLDDEVFSLINLLKRGGWMPHEIAMIERAVQRRSEEVRAGLASYTACYWTGKIQREIDDRTRMRWDFKNGWTLDRWAEGRWQVVGVFGFNLIRPHLIEYLRECDMQDTKRWATPEEYLQWKRDQAFKKQCDNWARGNQKLAAVVDGMTDRQIKEFINVERAMQTGETVTMHGATKRVYDRLARASRRSPAAPTGQAINPGHRFKVLKRQTGGKHRLER